MENNSLLKSEKKPEKKEDPFVKLRGHLKTVGQSGLAKKKLFLVLDASGSMNQACENGKSKIEAVRNVVTDVLSEYSAKVPINLVSFSDSSEILQGINLYHTIGGTNIASSLRLLELNCQAVLLSDGDQTYEDARDEIPRLIGDGITVHCIGVGVSIRGERLLREIADRTGGFYAGIEANFSQIFETFKKLAGKAVAALTEGGSND